MDGQRDAVDDLLDGPKTNGEAKHGGAKGLDEGAAGALPPGHLAHQGAKPWPIAAVMLGRQVSLQLMVMHARLTHAPR